LSGLFCVRHPITARRLRNLPKPVDSNLPHSIKCIHRNPTHREPQMGQILTPAFSASRRADQIKAEGDR
jgi:hypothetical protein